MTKLITATHAAEILNVSVQRIYELVRLRLLPPGVAVHVGRQVRVDESWGAKCGSMNPDSGSGSPRAAARYPVAGDGRRPDGRPSRSRQPRRSSRNWRGRSASRAPVTGLLGCP